MIRDAGDGGEAKIGNAGSSALIDENVRLRRLVISV